MSSDSNAEITKFVLDRINQTEIYLSTIYAQVGKVCRKEARLRDCNDEIVHNMLEFVNREGINTSLKQSLQQYANHLSEVEDYRDTLITRVETQILKPIAKYDKILKYKRQVQKAIAARDKGLERQHKLQQTSYRNQEPHQISAMQVNAEYAQTKSSRADHVVQDEIDKLEEMKLEDIKKYLTDFTLIHVAFHARAMEMYTLAHQQLLNIDVPHELEEFRKVPPIHHFQPARSGLQNASPVHERSSKHKAAGVSSESKSAKPDAAESYSSDSSDSED